jgi:hypothetical protein
MITYTPEQLHGSGSYAPSLAKNTTYTFSVDNPGDCAYLALETILSTQEYAYTSTSPKNLSGSFANYTNMVNNVSFGDYIAAFVIPSGSCSFTFTPATNVIGVPLGATLRVRGTGKVSLTIS